MYLLLLSRHGTAMGRINKTAAEMFDIVRQAE